MPFQLRSPMTQMYLCDTKPSWPTRVEYGVSLLFSFLLVFFFFFFCFFFLLFFNILRIRLARIHKEDNFASVKNLAFCSVGAFFGYS